MGRGRDPRARALFGLARFRTPAFLDAGRTTFEGSTDATVGGRDAVAGASPRIRWAMRFKRALPA